MGCFRRTYRNRQGKEQQSKKYTVQFMDHMDIVRRVTAVPDKSASESIERSILKLVSLRIAGLAPDVESARFLESCLPEIRNNLAEWKVITKERAAAGKHIDQHIAEWVDHVRSRDTTPKHIKEFRNKVGKLKAKYKWSSIADITTTNIKDYINHLRDENKAAATINHHIRAMRSFCNWLMDGKRLTENPMTGIKLLNEAADRRLVRRRLTVEVMRHILTTTYSSKKHHGLTGPHRYLLYRFAALTGLRWSEIRSLSRLSFSFDATPPTVHITAKDSKSKKAADLILRDDLAAELKAHMASFNPTDKAFPGMWREKGSEMVEKDLETAGVPYRDASGKQFDFHAWRGQLATLLNQSGTPLVTAQRIMRHSDPKLTANMYTDVFEEDKARELAKIPSTSISASSSLETRQSEGEPGHPNKSADTKADTKIPNADEQIRTYTNDKKDELSGRARVIRMIEEMQDVDFQDDKGMILMFPPVAQGKMAVGQEKTLIPQGDKGSEILAPPAGFTNVT